MWWNGEPSSLLRDVPQDWLTPISTVSTASIFLLSQVFALAATSIHGWHGLAIPTILTGCASSLLRCRFHNSQSFFKCSGLLTDHYSVSAVFWYWSVSASNPLDPTTGCSASLLPSLCVEFCQSFPSRIFTQILSTRRVNPATTCSVESVRFSPSLLLSHVTDSPLSNRRRSPCPLFFNRTSRKVLYSR